jgi:type I restriction enzyme S subunit
MIQKKYPAHKPSGVEWIGDIPLHWEVKPLKRLAKICNGQDQKSVQSDQGNFPIYGSGGIFGRATEYLHSGPSVILGRKGTIDKPQYVDGPFWSVDTAYFTDISESTHPRFFYYLCTTIDFERYKYGSAVPSMTQEVLNTIPFAVSDYNEQKAIASYLDQKTALIDSTIRKKERLIELLQEERTAIINRAVTRALDPNVPMKDSGVEWLGQIPSHWGKTKLKTVLLKIGSGVTPKGGAEIYQTSGIPLLRSQNIHFDGLRLDDVAYITEDIHRNMNISRVVSGDVLLNITGASIGRCFYVDDWLGEANVNQHVCILRPDNDITTKYLYYYLASELSQLQIGLLQTGANREGLNFEQLGNFFLPLPNIEEQKQIVKILDQKVQSLNNLSTKVQTEISLLKEYRTALINEVVTGKRCVINEPEQLTTA